MAIARVEAHIDDQLNQLCNAHLKYVLPGAGSTSGAGRGNSKSVTAMLNADLSGFWSVLDHSRDLAEKVRYCHLHCVLALQP